MKDRQRRNFWMPSEIDMMLNLIKNFQTSHGCTSTTHTTFVQIANRMKKCGFHNKSALQIRRKWFQMKSAYLCYKRGNEERLLLIPEEFRSKIAQFVEAESKYGYMRAMPPRTYDAKKTNYTIESQLPEDSAIANYANKINSNNYKPKLERTKTPVTMNATKTKAATDLDYKYAYCEQQLDKFLVHNKELRRLLQKDIKRMQAKLADYQKKCQTLRETNIREFLDNYSNIYDFK